MGDIVELFRKSDFDPETVRVLCDAYDKASRWLHDNGQPDIVKEVIARRIISLAKKGSVIPTVSALARLRRSATRRCSKSKLTAARRAVSLPSATIHRSAPMEKSHGPGPTAFSDRCPAADYRGSISFVALRFLGGA